jgi:competence protein ComEC
LRYAGGVLATTLIAGLATAPFAIYHFNRFALYGMVANLLAVPLVGLWVMPMAVLAVVLMPFGLDGPALTAMGWGVDGVLAIADTVVAWPGAVIDLPSPPFAGLLAVTFGGLWMCLWRRPWRWLGTVPIAAGLAAAAWTVPPDIVIDDRASLTAVLDSHGDWRVSSLQSNQFARELLQRRYGSRQARVWRRDGSLTDPTLRCDAIGCIYRRDGQTVALSWDARAQPEDCRAATVVISTVPVRRHCSAATVVDRFSLWRNGAHAVWLRFDGVRVETVAQWEGDRPWTVHRPPVRPRRRDSRRYSANAGRDRRKTRRQ